MDATKCSLWVVLDVSRNTSVPVILTMKSGNLRLQEMMQVMVNERGGVLCAMDDRFVEHLSL